MEESIYNKKILKENRRALRNNLTQAEVRLWKALQGKQLAGIKFRRQYSVGNYILDFYCPAERSDVELDGAGHLTPDGLLKDQIRDQYLTGLQIKVLRFENKLVLEALEGVLENIKHHFKPD